MINNNDEFIMDHYQNDDGQMKESAGHLIHVIGAHQDFKM